MSDHFNRLTSAEAERLALLAEECGEVVQAIGKVLRHGYESVNPDVDLARTNREELAVEIGHVVAASNLLMLRGDLDQALVYRSAGQKTLKVGKYLHHQENALAALDKEGA